MSDWKPEPDRAVDVMKLPLSAEEGFVLSRLDGTTDLKGVSALTGFSAAKVEGIVSRLVSLGAVRAQSGLPAPPPLASLPTPPPIAPLGSPGPEPAPLELTAADEVAGSAEPLEGDGEPDDAPEREDPGLHRALFERTLHDLTEDQRVIRARTAVEPELSAFCFDPLPSVVKAVLENPRAALTQARLIARHHRNPVGLEAVVARAAFAADVVVRRSLTRNPQLPASVLRRLFAAQRLLVQHKLSIDRDVPEGTRRTARELLRARFQSGPPEERIELILKTEGRALTVLTGLTLDGKTTSLLCGRAFGSTLLVQNLARWGATPPPLISHLLRQDLVRRQPQLRAMLLRHPNAPAEAKRGQ